MGRFSLLTLLSFLAIALSIVGPRKHPLPCPSGTYLSGICCSRLTNAAAHAEPEQRGGYLLNDVPG